MRFRATFREKKGKPRLKKTILRRNEVPPQCAPVRSGLLSRFRMPRFSLQGKQKSERKSSLNLVCLSLAFLFDYRQRPILPGRFQPSTFGAKRLNFCVRNGNRWIPLAIVTGMVECVLHTHNYTAQSIDALFRSLFLRFCDQALDLLVSVSSMHYCTYTPDLSTL